MIKILKILVLISKYVCYWWLLKWNIEALSKSEINCFDLRFGALFLFVSMGLDSVLAMLGEVVNKKEVINE